jgi:hypothetical protein
MPRATPPLVVRAGPREATGTRTLRVAGRPVTVALLLELRGEAAAQERKALLRDLSDHALTALEEGHGGLTSRMRAALDALDDTLRREAAGRGRPLVAGATLAAVTVDELLVAQAGPAVAFLASVNQPPQRLPARGPWLRRESLGATEVGQQPPLGGGPGGVAGPQIQWMQFPAAAGTRLLLAATPAAGALPREVTSALFRTPLARMGPALDAALPAGSAALLLAPADPPIAAHPALSKETWAEEGAPRAQSATVIGQSGGIAALRERATARLAPLRDAAVVQGRRAGRATARGAAKVLLGLFPARMAADRGGADWMRLAATAVLGLPVAALLLTALLVTRERRAAPASPQAASEAAIPEAGEGDLGAASADGSGEEGSGIAGGDVADRAAGITRLGDLRLEAALAGAPTEPRDLVAVGDATYVLNRDRGLVEWISAGESRTAWRQGASVGGVVAGAPIDLFWLAAPAGGEGGRATVLDAAGRLWPLEGDNAAVLDPLEDGAWRVVLRAAGYDGRLYLLDRGGRIHRYTPLDGSGASGVIDLVFGNAPEAWLQAEVDLSRARDMAIDGRILVLLDDGTVLALQGGGLTSFAVTGMPERMVDPRDLYSSPGADHILVADHGAGEVIVLGADGAFRSRLRLPPQPRASDAGPAQGRLPELHAVWWDEAAGRLWLVSGNALYQAAYAGSPALRR